jgi:3-oxoacyl-[acyl-carrier protein] reductase
MELTEKTALVTGGGTGLGREISLQIAALGANVAVVYSKSESEARETVGDLRKAGVRAEAYRADVSNSDDVRTVVDSVARDFERLDVLVNDAGTTKFVPFADLHGIEETDWDRLMNVNAKGPWMLTRAAAPHLKAARGSILNVASVAGFRPAGSSLAYCVSKAALIHLTSCLAVAMAPEVRVNGIAPGLFLSRWTEGFSEERIHGMVERTPLKRTTGLDDLARMAVELIRNDSMTGEMVVVDSGIRLG